MWIDALVFVDTRNAGTLERRILDAAMERRGWEKSGSGGYATSYIDPQSDEAIVNEVEQDVKQAVYVAGITQFDAVCLLSDAESTSARDGEYESYDSDLNLDTV